MIERRREEIMQRVTRAETATRMLESVIDGEMLPPLSPAAVAENGGERRHCPSRWAWQAARLLRMWRDVPDEDTQPVTETEDEAVL